MDKPTERGPKCQRGTSRTSGLSSGERAPDFVAPLEGAGPARFYGRAGGRPALVIFAAGVCASTRAALDAAEAAASRHLVVPDEAEAAPLPEVDLFRDDGKLRAAFRLPEDGSARAVVLDRNLRVLDGFDLGGEAAAGRLAGLLRQASAEAPAATITAQAPVLFVPRVLDPDHCEHLRQLWSGAHADTGVGGFQGRGGAHARIIGDRGRLVVPAPYHPGAESRFEVVPASGEERTETTRTGTPPFQPAIEFFQRCMRGEETPAYMADHAEGTLRVVEAAFESARGGRRVDLA